MAASPARSSASPRKKNIRRSTITAARSAKLSRSPMICSTSRATRPRSASKPDRTRHWARPPSSPSSGSMAPSNGCGICWRAPIPRSRSSAPGVTCCAPPRGLSPNATTEAPMAGKQADDPRLLRFRKLPTPVRVVYARPRLFIAITIGFAAFFFLPGSLRLVTRLLISWDVFVSFYLVLAYTMMFRCDLAHIRRNAVLQDDGRFLILLVTALGAFASIAAILFELGASNRSGPQLTLATVTIALSWTMVHTTFALHYAHDYYRGAKPGGLQFPSGDEHDHADYWDFVYFSFVIGMTAQVSDVGITDKTIRRTATVHGIISFVFNTALVALMVNIAASAI